VQDSFGLPSDPTALYRDRMETGHPKPTGNEQRNRTAAANPNGTARESHRPTEKEPHHPSLPGRWARNLLAFLLGLVFVFAPLEVGLRLVHRSVDPRVLVYPRVATDINGFKDPGFDRRVPPGEYRILALGASAFVTREFRRRFETALNESA